MKATLQLVKDTVVLSFRTWWYIPASFGLDVLFFIAWGFFVGSLLQKMVERVGLILIAFSGALASAGQRIGEFTLGSIAAQDPMIKTYAIQALVLFLIASFASYFLFTLFHSFVWYMTGRAARVKVEYGAYAKKFLKATIIGYVLYMVYDLLGLGGRITDIFSQRLNEPPGVVYPVVLAIYLIFLLYFLHLYFAFLLTKHGKRTFLRYIKVEWKKVLYLFAILLAWGVLLQVIMYPLQQYAPMWVAVVVGLILVMPSMAIGRMLLVRAMH